MRRIITLLHFLHRKLSINATALFFAVWYNRLRLNKQRAKTFSAYRDKTLFSSLNSVEKIFLTFFLQIVNFCRLPWLYSVGVLKTA